MNEQMFILDAENYTQPAAPENPENREKIDMVKDILLDVSDELI